SWLHDRRFFTTARFDWIPLVLLAAVAFAAESTTMVPWRGAMLTAFGAGVVMAWVSSPVVKLASLLVLAALAAPLQSSPVLATFLVLLLITVVHVYVFTGIFILAGSLKSRSLSGFLSLGVYLACGLGLLLAHPVAAGYQIGPATQANLRPFLPIIGAMAMIVP